MLRSEQTIVSCALTGSVHTPTMSPHLPITPQQIIDQSLEDNLYLERGRLAVSNAEQVRKAARILDELGRPTATPDQVRSLLKLKGTGG
jgi:uncharacterized protein (DUF849 family)